MILLRAVPPELVQGVASGIYTITGSVVRDVASGRGVGFLQETGVLQTILGNVMTSGANPLGAFVNLGLGAASVIQNQQIKARLAELQSSLAILQNLQLGTLAVSGLGLGVSVAGFAAMLKRLKGIEDHLGTIDAKIDNLTSERRSDDVRMIFADIRTQLDVIDTLSARSYKISSAEAAERALAKSAGRLEAHFQQKSESMQIGAIVSADMDFLWSLAAAIRVCHEAGLRALFTIEELEAAKKLAERHAQRFLDLSQPLTPDVLARLSSQNVEDAIAYSKARRLALPQAEVLVLGLRNSVASISSQSELAQSLLTNQISGADYLKEIENEKNEPLIMLPA